MEHNLQVGVLGNQCLHWHVICHQYFNAPIGKVQSCLVYAFVAGEIGFR